MKRKTTRTIREGGVTKKNENQAKENEGYRSQLNAEKGKESHERGTKSVHGTQWKKERGLDGTKKEEKPKGGMSEVREKNRGLKWKRTKTRPRVRPRTSRRKDQKRKREKEVGSA